jgi:DNA-directed RNA polymerase subunit L
MTLVSVIGFRSDPPGVVLDTPDIKILQNDSNTQPNELLAHRISLIPIHGADPLKWDPDRIVFKLDVTNESPDPRDVMAADIQVFERRKAADLSEALVEIPGRTFFPANTLTRDTCLITTLPGKRSSQVPTLKAEMRATVGLGREHARFIPTSQASYAYTLDTNTERRNQHFERWLVRHKKVEPDSLKDDEARRSELDREFKTMEIQRIYLVDEKGEPNSFDFQIESIGPMAPRAIVERALLGLIEMCKGFVGLDAGDLPESISTVSSDTLMTGFDFTIKNQDHTFGNMIQTWLVEHHVEGEANPRLNFAGYKIPHPLKDEMLLRIGVDDGNELTARTSIAMAARGCQAMFESWLAAWTGSGSGSGSGTAASTLAAGKKSIKLKRTPAV